MMQMMRTMQQELMDLRRQQAHASTTELALRSEDRHGRAGSGMVDHEIVREFVSHNTV